MSILAIDYGTKRIGLAISTYEEFVKPIGVVSPKNFDKTLGDLLKSEKIEKIVVGLPDGKLKNTVIGFARKLIKNYKIEVLFSDETLSSQRARENLIISGLNRKKRRNNLDAYAACFILEEFLKIKNEKLIN